MATKTTTVKRKPKRNYGNFVGYNDGTRMIRFIRKGSRVVATYLLRTETELSSKAFLKAYPVTFDMHFKPKAAKELVAFLVNHKRETAAAQLAVARAAKASASKAA